MRSFLNLFFALFFTITYAQDRILLLGNSYTANNNLPMVFEQLANDGGHPVITQSSTPGGYTLGAPPNAHTSDPNSQQLIKQGDWKYVILQGQSQVPVIPYFRDLYFFSGAESLVDTIKAYNPCAMPMLYMTWGRRFGGQQCGGNECSPDFVDFFHYQDSLNTAYSKAANDNQIPVSPVGMAWAKVLQDTNIVLHAGDNSHPKFNGTYLAACTFYAMIFGESPEGINYTGSLTQAEATYLQSVAATVVFNGSSDWNKDLEVATAVFDFQVQDDSIVVFNNSSINATYFEWRFGDGGTSNDENPTYTYKDSGKYEVILTTHRPCGIEVFSDSVEINIPTAPGPSFIKSAEGASKGIVIYPNPTSGKAIMLDGYSGFFEIIDVSGRVQQTGSVQKNEAIPLTLKPGIYFFKPIGYSQTNVVRFIAE